MRKNVKLQSCFSLSEQSYSLNMWTNLLFCSIKKTRQMFGQRTILKRFYNLVLLRPSFLTIPIFLGGSSSWRDQMISACKWCQGQSQVPTSQGSLTISTDLLLHQSQSQENLMFWVTFDRNPITIDLSHENCCWQSSTSEDSMRIEWLTATVGEQLLVHRWDRGNRQASQHTGHGAYVFICSK